MENMVTIILAAGKGTRMKSDLVKVLHPIAGKPMLSYPVEAARALKSDKIIIVVGHQAEKVKRQYGNEDILFVEQSEQLGSGHAVSICRDMLRGFTGRVLILCGDVPLITQNTLAAFTDAHCTGRATVSVLTVHTENPSGYGRIIRDSSNNIKKIVEEKDATLRQKAIKEINTGIYCCESPFLFRALRNIDRNNKQGEYYLPDIITLAVREGAKILGVVTEKFHEVRGINNRIDLSEAEKIMRDRILKEIMSQGVTIVDPASTYIDHGITIGQDTIIYPNTLITGNTIIGSNCRIDLNCSITDSTIGNGVHIKSSCVIQESRIEDGVFLGPFAHVRPQSHIEKKASIGNFVEVKKSHIGTGSKANHLTYLGDTTIEEGVNIGAGTITCNYDGKRKHLTVIREGSFIGSNTSLVAPVKIGRNAVVGAGSTITKDVPDESLAVARSRQINYDNWLEKGKKVIKSKKMAKKKGPD